MLPIRVLFVCTGNICRSPTAEGVFRKLAATSKLAKHITVDSAGLIRFSEGKPPDRQALRIAKRRGLDLSNLRARRIEAADIDRFDWIVVMTQEHRQAVQALGATGSRPHLRILPEFAHGAGTDEVPDPYGEDDGAFESVYDLIEAGCRGLLAECIRQAESKN